MSELSGLPGSTSVEAPVPGSARSRQTGTPASMGEFAELLALAQDAGSGITIAQPPSLVAQTAEPPSQTQPSQIQPGQTQPVQTQPFPVLSGQNPTSPNPADLALSAAAPMSAVLTDVPGTPTEALGEAEADDDRDDPDTPIPDAGATGGDTGMPAMGPAPLAPPPTAALTAYAQSAINDPSADRPSAATEATIEAMTGSQSRAPEGPDTYRAPPAFGDDPSGPGAPSDGEAARGGSAGRWPERPATAASASGPTPAGPAPGPTEDAAKSSSTPTAAPTATLGASLSAPTPVQIAALPTASSAAASAPASASLSSLPAPASTRATSSSVPAGATTPSDANTARTPETRSRRADANGRIDDTRPADAAPDPTRFDPAGSDATGSDPQSMTASAGGWPDSQVTAPPTPSRTASDSAARPTEQIASHLAPVVMRMDISERGVQRLTIRLDPVELGQVEIRVEQGQNLPARVQILVERPETLALLRGDQAALERALDRAGVAASGRDVVLDLSPAGSAPPGSLPPGSSSDPRQDGDPRGGAALAGFADQSADRHGQQAGGSDPRRDARGEGPPRGDPEIGTDLGRLSSAQAAAIARRGGWRRPGLNITA